MNRINVNQLGYKPYNKKIFVCDCEETEYKIVNKNDGGIVFKGKTSKPKYDEASGESVVIGDFTDLTICGEYYIAIENLENSYSFSIDNDIYINVNHGLLKALYLQRCGMELNKKFAGKWCHEICHIGEGALHEDPKTKLEISGGWHDAGDYGRYVVAAAKALADILLAYDFFGEAFQDEINIPESGNGMPDILNEAKYELNWLFKMQDINSGGVYHKVATQFFPDMIMPEADLEPLIIYPISSPATGDFVAVMAMAARIYKKIDVQFSEKCLRAAEKSWKWLINNPNENLFKNPPNMNSGEYGDNIDLDERYWAAAELYRTTGQVEYHTYFMKIFENLKDTNSLGWADVGGYGTIAYLFTEVSKVDTEILNVLKSRFFEQADKFVVISEEDGFKVTLKPEQYIWGSNMNILNNAMHLIIANIMKPNIKYVETALHQWNYILGMNSLSQCYITGYGSNPIMNPHHRPSSSDNIVDPVPGMISGGPCSGLHDEAAIKDCKGKSPAKCFTDNEDSYSTNEITIYWNSPAIFVSGYANYIEK